MSETEADFEDVAADEQVEDVDDARPGWLPANFETPEALVASYKEIERAFHERSERLSQVEAQLAELAEAVELQAESYAEPTWAEGQDDPAAAMRQAMSQRDLRAAIAAKMSETQAVNAVQVANEMLAATLPDWIEKAPAVAAKIAAQPYLLPASAQASPDAAAAALAAVYESVKRDQAAAAQAAQALTWTKQQAQTMSGQGQRQPAETSNEEWARSIREADLGQFRL